MTVFNLCEIYDYMDLRLYGSSHKRGRNPRSSKRVIFLSLLKCIFRNAIMDKKNNWIEQNFEL